ncbi:hypothetical protein RKD21_006580 [Streptomyces albogriseolus]|uniref:Uncharacterized protein n=1 Tax=Streptomyces albogriseolus TaxID=1887 RepID=A0ACC6UYB4_STRAO
MIPSDSSISCIRRFLTAELHRTIGFRGASVVEGADGRRIGWEVQLSTVDERGLRGVRARTGKAAKNGITPAWHTDRAACSQRNDAHRPRSDRLPAHVVARNGDLRIVSGFRARGFRHCDTSALHPCPNGIRRCGKVHATVKPRDVFSDDMVRQTAAGTVVPVQFRAGTSVHRYWVTSANRDRLEDLDSDDTRLPQNVSPPPDRGWCFEYRRCLEGVLPGLAVIRLNDRRVDVAGFAR